ncbi:MAG TPA: phosphoglycerate dehydrogenase [Oscillospiraceae bacterium]|nr:phosphoglycerate dehydrogenase [Oscillospiraceae bacterium]HPF56125.1 phosphoglycerate dehydrogenase [Clostridiales bacterium]HPK35689.1 phosphoglycerate dehydrogenase [Oscillospiraceae bacterium]HPR76400.1 phosphoglycerate dehydrogenase [Oscillospiraceae bacterium]
MYKIQTLNAISDSGLSLLTPPEFTVCSDCTEPDGIILRSFNMNDMELPKSLLAVARAGAGVNNIPIDACSDRGIVVFNTPGANANAVKELVVAALLLSSRKIAEGIAWAKTLTDAEDVAKTVEKGKSQFIGPEIRGKKLGVIGLGAIGAQVANTGYALDMQVCGHDPFLSVDAAWSLSRAVKKACSIEELVATSDYISLHVPYTEKTKGLYGKELFQATKKGARLLNFSRGELVDTAALADAIADGTIACYATDFPSKEVLALPNTLCIPHLGASTPESEDNCAEMAAEEMINYLKYGIIRNSVNFPACNVPYGGKPRVTVLHKNIPNMVSSITSIISGGGHNIEYMSNQSRGNWAYTLIDLDNELTDTRPLLERILGIMGVTGARII